MSRKSATFAQLIDYITTGQIDEKYNVFQNVYQRNYSSLKREFETNARHLAQRKNGVYLYHEILSITRAKGISEQRQKEIFCQLAQSYAQGRAGQNMVFAGMHDDKSHNLHYHFVISANGVNDSKRLRLSKAEFSKFKIDFEQMVLQQYPELEQEVIIQRSATSNLSNKAGEMKRRTGKVPERERVMGILNQAFERSFSHAEFIQYLDKVGFNFYIRGKNPGVEDRSNKRKYRLATLGLLEQLEALDDGIQKKEKAKPTQPKENEESEARDTILKEKTKRESEKNVSDNTTSTKRHKDDKMESSQDTDVSNEQHIQHQRKAEMKSRRAESSSKESSNKNKRKR